MTRTSKTVKTALLIAAVVICQPILAVAGSADDDEKTFIWTAQPTKHWPAGAKTLGVKPPVFDDSGFTGGIIRSDPNAWYTVFMGELKNLFQRGLPEMKIVERIDSAASTDEQWMSETGLADGATSAVKLRHADLLLIPRFTYACLDEMVSVERDAGKRTMEKAASAIPYVGFMVERKKYKEIRIRHVTVTCDLKINTITGVTLFTYSRSLAWRGLTRDGVLGFGKTDVRDLPETHTILKRLMKEHAQEFCSEFMPVRKEIKVNLRNMSRSLRPAVVAFNAGRFEEAGRIARSRHETHPRDDHALFILGICAESQGEWGMAAECYRRSADIENQQLEYLNALERVQGRDVVGHTVASEGPPKPAAGRIQQENPNVSEVTVSPD